jgi:hypothetical protein
MIRGPSKSLGGFHVADGTVRLGFEFKLWAERVEL